MTTWIVIAAVGVGSYVLRALPVLLGDRWPRSARFEEMIGHAGTAALAALIAVGLRGASTSATDAVAVGVAAATALLVAVRGRSMHTILLAAAVAYAAGVGGASLLPGWG